MKFLPGERDRARFPVQSGPVRVSARLGAVALVLLAGSGAFLAACGAGGEPSTAVSAAGPGGGGAGPAANSTNRVPNGSPQVGCVGASCSFGEGETLPPPPNCGDGALTEDEACDDGNLISGDGCSANCLIAEPGYSCATAGKACREIARCGDGIVAATEQCDDGNAAPNDGCSIRCRVELGKKCSGQPSVCSNAVCGDGVVEGSESCDDGNVDPFDGCSPLCLKEPNCSGLSCVSECGDGLLINEECDDGNRTDGDGCSAACTKEVGFDCVAQAACEQINGQCVLRVPAVFRDFGTHPDFGNKNCSALTPGAVADRLDQNGRPTLGPAAAQACMSTEANFSQWYSDSPQSVKVVGSILLFDNDAQGYVNRFGAEGQQFAAVAPQGGARARGATEAACTQVCLNDAQNGNAPFVGQRRCNDLCRPLNDMVQQLTVGRLNQLNNQLTQAQNAAVPDPATITQLEADIATVQAQLADLQAQAATCQTDCQTEVDSRVATCMLGCGPCLGNPAQFCLDEEVLSYDGTPVFFPVDSVTGPTANSEQASIPAAYGYDSYPLERTVYPNAPNHNFYFTSEVQYWFKYDAATQATLDFLGDDDVWVFLNGRLAVDLGGIHVPASGTLTINAGAGTVTSTIAANVANGVNRTTQASPADFGLVDGNVYTINIYHAERQLSGSSFKLTLAGFEATPSECTAVCGDGVLSFGEECDDGVNDGGYGECGDKCVLGPFCGDGIPQPEFGEGCDVGPGGDRTCRGCRLLEIR
jgi:fibro-slime domain-containing protein